VLLKPPFKIEAGLLLLKTSNIDLLGGDVEEFKQIWVRDKTQVESTDNSNAPKWVSVDSYEVKIFICLLDKNIFRSRKKQNKCAEISTHSSIFLRRPG
jgi:hypothetical protein